jgi:hypothetical protein
VQIERNLERSNIRLVCKHAKFRDAVQRPDRYKHKSVCRKRTLGLQRVWTLLASAIGTLCIPLFGIWTRVRLSTSDQMGTEGLLPSRPAKKG